MVEVKNARAGPNQDTPCAMLNREHKTTQPDRATLNREAQGRGGMGTGREEEGSEEERTERATTTQEENKEAQRGTKRRNDRQEQ